MPELAGELALECVAALAAEGDEEGALAPLELGEETVEPDAAEVVEPEEAGADAAPLMQLPVI